MFCHLGSSFLIFKSQFISELLELMHIETLLTLLSTCEAKMQLNIQFTLNYNKRSKDFFDNLN